MMSYEEVLEFLQGPYGWVVGAAAGSLLLFTLFLWWAVRRWRRSKQEFNEALASTRGMQLQMQNDAPAMGRRKD